MHASQTGTKCVLVQNLERSKCWRERHLKLKNYHLTFIFLTLPRRSNVITPSSSLRFSTKPLQIPTLVLSGSQSWNGYSCQGLTDAEKKAGLFLLTTHLSTQHCDCFLSRQEQTQLWVAFPLPALDLQQHLEFFTLLLLHCTALVLIYFASLCLFFSKLGVILYIPEFESFF